MARSLSRRVVGVTTALLAALALAGCVQGQGPLVSELRDVRPFNPFSRLVVGSGIEVVLTTGDVAGVAVSAPESILPAVATEVSGRTLTVDARDDFTSTRSVTVWITTPTIEAISLTGGAQLRGDAVAVDELALDVRGGSQLTISGRGGAVTLVGDDGSVVELGELDADTVDVSLAGGASASIHAADRITGTVSGGARVSVAGDAIVDVRTSDGASIDRLDRS